MGWGKGGNAPSKKLSLLTKSEIDFYLTREISANRGKSPSLFLSDFPQCLLELLSLGFPFAQFLKPLGISQSAFARQLDVSFPRLNEIINGKRSVTTDTALRLARVTGMSAQFWLGLQQDWDLWHALRSEKADAIAQLEPLAQTG